jgi:integrase
VKLPKKSEVREKRILDENQTARVPARLDDPNLLICEACIDSGTRIAEVTGLMIRHVDLGKGTIQIAQHNWRGDIDTPKTEKSKRLLALGELAARYADWISKLKHKSPDAWVFPQADDPAKPMSDSGVRQALKRAAVAERRDFPGFGPQLPAARQHRVAARGGRQQHRGVENRRACEYQGDRRAHRSANAMPGRADTQDSGQAREGGSAHQDLGAHQE